MTKDICRVKPLKSPTAAQILNNISGFDIVHFICHELADPKNPSNSHLLLQKSGLLGPLVDKLTVSNIFKKNIQGQLWIDYLSLCSTIRVEAKRLADKCLHITSTFQVAEFAHVICSLWPADNDVCVQLAEFFYDSLIKTGIKHSNMAVAEALHNTMLDIHSES